MASPLRSLQPTLTLERSSLRIWNVATKESTSVSPRIASERQCRTRRVWWWASGHFSWRRMRRTWRRPSARNWNCYVSRRHRVFQNPTSRTSRGELVRTIGLSDEEFRLTTAVCTSTLVSGILCLKLLRYHYICSVTCSASVATLTGRANALCTKIRIFFWSGCCAKMRAPCRSVTS